MSYSFDESWIKILALTLFQTINLLWHAQIGALPSYNASDIAMIALMYQNVQEQSAIGSLVLDDLLASHMTQLSPTTNLSRQPCFPRCFPKQDRPFEIRLMDLKMRGKVYLGDFWTSIKLYWTFCRNELWSLNSWEGLTPKTDHIKRFCKKNDKFKRLM